MRKCSVYVVLGGIRVLLLLPNVFASPDISLQTSIRDSPIRLVMLICRRESVFEPHLIQAQGLFQAIETSINQVSGVADQSPTQLQRLNWSQSNKRRVEGLIDRLRNIHSGVLTLLVTEAA